MKRTLITVVALLIASVEKNSAQQVASTSMMGHASVANADISDMVIGEDMMGLRRLANANSTKAAGGKKSGGGGGGGDDGEGSGDENAEGAPDEKSMAGDEEDALAAKQGAPEISEEQQEANADAADDKMKADFDKKALDTTEDFTDDMFKAVARKGPKYIKKIKRFGAVSNAS